MNIKRPGISTKHLAVDKAYAQTVIIIAVAAFVTVFCLVASNAVLGQNKYQSRVISKKETAHNQLKKNLQAFNSLTQSYKALVSAPLNVIGGSSSGSAPNDGDNAKIILDALPSSYDFPALTSSIEKVLTDQSLSITSIEGTDDQVNQQNNVSSSNPQAVSIPFTFTVGNANYLSVQHLITSLQQSIRPIQIDSIDLKGGADNMNVTVSAHTYYQPAKSLGISKEVVK